MYSLRAAKEKFQDLIDDLFSSIGVILSRNENTISRVDV